MSKQTKRATLRDMTLLMRILKSFSDAVGVPTLPVYKMRLPPMVILEWLGSSFCGRTLQTTEVQVISLRLSEGISW